MTNDPLIESSNSNNNNNNKGSISTDPLLDQPKSIKVKKITKFGDGGFHVTFTKKDGITKEDLNKNVMIVFDHPLASNDEVEEDDIENKNKSFVKAYNHILSNIFYKYVSDAGYPELITTENVKSFIIIRSVISKEETKRNLEITKMQKQISNEIDEIRHEEPQYRFSDEETKEYENNGFEVVRDVSLKNSQMVVITKGTREQYLELRKKEIFWIKAQETLRDFILERLNTLYPKVHSIIVQAALDDWDAIENEGSKELLAKLSKNVLDEAINPYHKNEFVPFSKKKGK